MGARGELYSTRYATQYGQRTYFFNIKENRFNDLFLSIVESIKKESFDSSFQRHQIAIFQIDWLPFLGFVHKIQENLTAGNFSWRCCFISKEEKRSYYAAFNKKNRLTRIMLSEKKPEEVQEESRTISIDSADFPKFIEKLEHTLAHYKENLPASGRS